MAAAIGEILIYAICVAVGALSVLAAVIVSSASKPVPARVIARRSKG